MSFFSYKARHIDAFGAVEQQNSSADAVGRLAFQSRHLVASLHRQFRLIPRNVDAMDVGYGTYGARVHFDTVAHLRPSHHLRSVVERVLAFASMTWQRLEKRDTAGNHCQSHICSPRNPLEENIAPDEGAAQETHVQLGALAFIARHQTAFMLPCAFAIGFMIACSV